ncbi:Phage integrase family protein [Salegentibacter echinorum]|uniref:Phage integrase family protein n=1 Tax=Salegentibacter echinorum TaxID=1073325 RepID=A0A1M5LEM9_SALEC|nr:phage integrase SAM-like domain-containing protein [Salegentibacter echinorum]SHG63416.1 Phage integrase family protein [Salegentibacter echinorum]
MATIYFLYRSTREKAPLSIRLQDCAANGNKFQFGGKTELEVSKEYWEKTRHKKRNVSAKDKREISTVNNKLSEIENSILKAYKKEKPHPNNKNWLKNTLQRYYNPVKEEVRSDLLKDCIQNMIDTADVRENSQKGLGLSKSRVSSYKNLLRVVSKYQTRKKNPIRIKDIDLQFGRAFLKWLMHNQNYSESYARKKIDDLKTVCNDAKLDGVETSLQLGKIKGGKPKKEFIIYLTPKELEQIENTNLVSDAHKNVRKWFLFGCQIGQRGGDLLSITEKNFVSRDDLDVIELKQQKTGKDITIPITDKTLDILKEGLPKTISSQRFNTDIKEVCRIAGLDKPTKGSKIMMLDKDGNEIPKDKNGKYAKKGIKRTVVGTYPKYELISSHVCRRSFATNLYGIMPTPLIMQITAHSTEKMFLQYIGKNALDYAKLINDFYELQKLKKERKSQLKLIKNASYQN